MRIAEGQKRVGKINMPGVTELTRVPKRCKTKQNNPKIRNQRRKVSRKINKIP